MLFKWTECSTIQHRRKITAVWVILEWQCPSQHYKVPLTSYMFRRNCHMPFLWRKGINYLLQFSLFNWIQNLQIKALLSTSLVSFLQKVLHSEVPMDFVSPHKIEPSWNLLYCAWFSPIGGFPGNGHASYITKHLLVNFLIIKVQFGACLFASIFINTQVTTILSFVAFYFNMAFIYWLTLTKARVWPAFSLCHAESTEISHFYHLSYPVLGGRVYCCGEGWCRSLF